MRSTHYLKLRVVVHLDDQDIGRATIKLIGQNVKILRLEIGRALLLHDLCFVRQDLLDKIYKRKICNVVVSALFSNGRTP